jgi:AcrR family transcriptional regulator
MSQIERAPSLRDEQKRFTRRRLVEAAKEVFARTGYAAATIEDITNAAGASRATFYLHFRSKAEIVQELFLDVLLPESNTIYEDLHGLVDPSWDEVRDFVEQTLAYWDRHQTTLIILQQAMAVERDEIADTWSYALKDTSSVLAHYLEHVCGVEPEAAKARAIMLIGLLDRFYFFSHLPDVTVPRDAALDSLTDLWWTAMRREPSRPSREA